MTEGKTNYSGNFGMGEIQESERKSRLSLFPGPTRTKHCNLMNHVLSSQRLAHSPPHYVYLQAPGNPLVYSLRISRVRISMNIIDVVIMTWRWSENNYKVCLYAPGGVRGGGKLKENRRRHQAFYIRFVLYHLKKKRISISAVLTAQFRADV